MGVRVRSAVCKGLPGRFLVRLVQVARTLRREEYSHRPRLSMPEISLALWLVCSGVPVRIVSKRSLDSYRSKAQLLACRLGTTWQTA
jgi:hypothetical protein